jgi:hypothetical protein
MLAHGHNTAMFVPVIFVPQSDLQVDSKSTPIAIAAGDERRGKRERLETLCASD